MAVTLELTPSVEARLEALAQAQHVTLPEYLGRILTDLVVSGKAQDLSPPDRERLWRRRAEAAPDTPPLSDEAVSRESFYGDRG